MKKLIFVLMALIMMGNVSFAQDKAATAKQPKPKTEKAAKAKGADGKVEATKTKKDGTPDMRYKENKAKKEAAGPMKKDGTPDMRYKANKDAAAKKSAEKKK